MWRYRLFDYPLDGSEGDLETWCQRIAEDGWQLWDAGIGGIIDHNGQRVRPHQPQARRVDLREDLRT